MKRSRPKPISDKRRAQFAIRWVWHGDVFRRDDGKCRLCGKKGTDAHHITYRSQGGPDEPWNGILLCRADHERVHAEGGRTWRPRLYALTGGPPAGDAEAPVREA